MKDWESIIKYLENIGKLLGAITVLLAAFLVFLGRWKEFWEEALKPLWNEALKPFLKLLIASSLVFPNGLIIWLLLHWLAGHLELGIISNPVVFLQLLILPTVSVSLYSFLWNILCYPRLCSWLKAQGPDDKQSSGSERSQDVQPFQDQLGESSNQNQAEQLRSHNNGRSSVQRPNDLGGAL